MHPTDHPFPHRQPAPTSLPLTDALTGLELRILESKLDEMGVPLQDLDPRLPAANRH